MRIQHNISAMNAYRNYNTNASALSKNLEKLSSGYRINRAGDDAAGLAISEKMRAQITGLDAAGKNVKDGISLVKTAEGALQEVQDMLNRMDYLATQSANGTYDNAVDRANLQKEVDALKTEINRIADSANFNGQKLLNGELQTGKEVNLSAGVTVSKAGVVTQGTEAEVDLSGLANGHTVTINGKTYTMAGNADAANAKFNDLNELAKQVKDDFGYVLAVGTANKSTLKVTGKAMNLQIGDTADKFNQMDVDVKDMHAAALGIADLDISKPDTAQAAIATIKSAINAVSSNRGGLGAIQNRLEHTQKNLSVMRENIQDAESTIRDTDVADEMTAYTKNNILLQSAQAMLAQANQMPQGVLQLLQ